MSDASPRLTAALADRYRLERELGQGGMATVYLAEDVRHHRKVAIKVLHPELSAVLGPDRFLKEIELTANLQHPHILPLFDSGAAEGLLYYVMPYVEGESLRSRLAREKQLPIPDAVRIASEVAGALDYAHRRGVVHRDIKPENILLHDGRALVADFGIALAVVQAGGSRMTQTGMSLGTPQYMSPEQAMGEREISARSDLYALGCVTYEMLTGEPPFTGPTAQAIVARVMTEEPRSIVLQRNTVPPHVEDAVLVALAKLPADRFGGAAEFAAALTDGGKAQRRTGATRPRHPAVLPFSRPIVLIGALLLATALALWGWLRPRPVSEVPAVRFEFRADSTHSIAQTCCGPQLATTPDGNRVFYVGLMQGVNKIFSRDLDGLGTNPIPGTEGASEVFVSPDGAWLGFRVPAQSGGVGGGGDWELRKVPVGGGTTTLIARMAGWPYGATWLDDGTIVVAADTRLLRVAASGGTPTRIGSADSNYVGPASLPGSKQILVTSTPPARAARSGRPTRAAGSSIQLLSLADGTTREIAEGARGLYADGQLITASEGTVVRRRFDPQSGLTLGSPETIATGLSSALDFAVGPSGLLVYAVGSAGGVIDLVDGEGNARASAGGGEGATHYDNPRFSRDGKRLVAAAGGYPPGTHQVVVFDLERHTSLHLTFDGRNEFVDWSPDGKSVVYQRNDSSIAIQPADRSGAERILVPPGKGSIARVTVGGRWLAFAAKSQAEGSSHDILIAPFDSGAAARPYMATPFDEQAPALSPDGRWLAYTSNESGREEVYASSAPTPGAREVISTSGGAEPVWSRDGRTIYYRTVDGKLMAVSVRNGAGLEVIDRRPLFRFAYEVSPDGADFDVDPTGREFAMLRRRTLDTKLVVVTDALRPARAGIPK